MDIPISSFEHINNIISDIDMNDVAFLRSLRFSLNKKVNIIGVSTSTLMRSINESDTIMETFFDISDAHLDKLITQIKLQCLLDGEEMMIDHLACLGRCVERSHLRTPYIVLILSTLQ